MIVERIQMLSRRELRRVRFVGDWWTIVSALIPFLLGEVPRHHSEHPSRLKYSSSSAVTSRSMLWNFWT